MLYRDHTVSLCGTHTVQGGGRVGFASNSNPTLGLPSPPTTTPKIAIPQLRGEYQSQKVDTVRINAITPSE